MALLSTLRLPALCIAALLVSVYVSSALAQPKVVVSIKPIHSLVSAVMKGVGEPALLVQGAGSPHSYSLKPSQSRILESADLVFWLGPRFETFLSKPIGTIAAKAVSIELLDTSDLEKLSVRSSSIGDEHNSETTGHDHDHEEGFDPHVWLDPVNAGLLTNEIAKSLANIDQQNAAAYKANAEKVSQSLGQLMETVDEVMHPVKGKQFVVFHDAFQYFERRFALKASASLVLNASVMPGAARVNEIRNVMRKNEVTCVFAEPQFDPKLISVVIEGSTAKTAVLDPLGSSLPNGPELYFQLIRNMATSMRNCLEN